MSPLRAAERCERAVDGVYAVDELRFSVFDVAVEDDVPVAAA